MLKPGRSMKPNILEYWITKPRRIMKKLFTLVFVVAAIGSYSSACAESFDAKLKRFIMIEDNKYAPEISRDEAIKLGFTVNDYDRFVGYVDSMNVRTERALAIPKNLFLDAFVELDPQSGMFILNIPLEKALRAGASVEGYFQRLKVLDSMNENMSDDLRNEGISFLKNIHKDMMDFAIRNPDSSAVQKFFTPPPMPKF